MSDSRRAALRPPMRAAQCASALAIAVAGIAVIAFAGHTWSWPLFIWGLSLGPLIINCQSLVSDLGGGSPSTTAAEPAVLRALAAQRLRRNWGAYLVTCCIGLTVGAVSARSNNDWPDVLLTAYLAPLIVYPILKRISAARRTG